MKYSNKSRIEIKMKNFQSNKRLTIQRAEIFDPWVAPMF